MPQDTAAEPPRYRRPSKRHLMKTLRKLKALLPPQTSGAGAEDVVDFLERLVANCELVVCPRTVRGANAPVIDAMDLPPSPPRSPLSSADDESEEAVQLGSLPAFSRAAIDDIADQLCSLGADELV